MLSIMLATKTLPGAGESFITTLFFTHSFVRDLQPFVLDAHTVVRDHL
jgi:hypothetical protein